MTLLQHELAQARSVTIDFRSMKPARALKAVVVWIRRQERVDLGERLAKTSSAVIEGEEQPARLGGVFGSRVGSDD